MPTPISYRLFAVLASCIVILVLSACGGDKGTTPKIDSTPPSPISNFQADSVDQGTVWLSWTATGDDGDIGTAAAYDLRYAPDPGKLSNEWNNARIAAGLAAPRIARSPESFILTGLPPDTVFYLAIKARDEAGNNSTISNIVFTLWDATAPAMISDFGLDSVYQGTAYLSWTATGDDGNEGTASGYHLRYAVDSITLKNDWDSALIADGLRIPNSPGSRETYELTNLPSDTIFYLAIKAEDDGGQISEISNIVSAFWSENGKIIMPDLTTTECENVAMPITVDNFSGVAGIEIHIRYEVQTMTYDSATSDYLNGMITNANDSLIHIIWADLGNSNPLSVPDGEALAIMHFSNLTGIGLLSFDDATQIVDTLGNPFVISFTDGSAECSAR